MSSRPGTFRPGRRCRFIVPGLSQMATARAALASLLVLLLWALAASAEPTVNSQSMNGLTGATVLSRDGELAGVVDAVIDAGAGKQSVVIGLAGYLGAGEKDVLMPATGAERLPAESE